MYPFLDENECKYRPCDVFAHCTNTLGSFFCTCFPGYQGDGFQCEGTLLKFLKFKFKLNDNCEIRKLSKQSKNKLPQRIINIIMIIV